MTTGISFRISFELTCINYTFRANSEHISERCFLKFIWEKQERVMQLYNGFIAHIILNFLPTLLFLKGILLPKDVLRTPPTISATEKGTLREFPGNTSTKFYIHLFKWSCKGNPYDFTSNVSENLLFFFWKKILEISLKYSTFLTIGLITSGWYFFFFFPEAVRKRLTNFLLGTLSEFSRISIKNA